MNGECLSHLLTEEERNHFEEQGYLYVPNALSSEMVEHLTNVVNKLHNYWYIALRAIQPTSCGCKRCHAQLYPG